MSAESHHVASTIPDLAARWKMARESAFRNVTAETKTEKVIFAGLNDLEESKFEDLLKLVFLNSRNLGISYQKAKNFVWERDDFVLFLQELGSPCLQGSWERRPTAAVLSRHGCESGRTLGQRSCQYWREAIDGLVMGISDEVGFARNQSICTQHDDCVDVFYEEEASLTDAIWGNTNRWGLLPDSVKSDLAAIEKKYRELKIDLKFLGIKEKDLFYKLEPKENLTCGSAGTIYRLKLEELVKDKFPDLTLKDASPIAVYGERA